MSSEDQKPESPSAEPRPAVDPRIEARRNDVQARRRLRVWITVGAVIVVVAIAFGITQSPLLDVDEVEVIGGTRTGADQILEAAGVEPGTPLLGLDLSGPRKAIAALPWVDQVRSRRTWGGKVTFDVTEREVVAQIPVDESWALVDRRGRVLQLSPVRQSLPVVLFGTVPEPGAWVPGKSVLRLLEASEALMPLQANGIGSISLVNGQVIVELPGDGQVIWGGQDDPQGKAVALATILAEADLNCLETVNLSVPELPVLTRHDPCP